MELRLNAAVGSRHPERESGEIFLGYCNLGGFEEVGLSTKRVGTKVFDDDGMDVTKEARTGPIGTVIFPVFASAPQHQRLFRR